MDEGACYRVLRHHRWRDGVRCARCGGARVTVHTRSGDTPRLRYLCLDCRRTFNDLTGTVFAGSNLPLAAWFRALSLLPERLTTVELARALSLKWDTARRISRRLVVAAGQPGLVRDLQRPPGPTCEGAVNRVRGAGGFLKVIALAAGLAFAAPAGAQPQPSALARSKALYESRCAVCHGVDGRADTPVAQHLRPRPRNFTDPVEIARLSEEQMYRAIKDGKPGTAMASWAQILTEPQIGDLIDYIRTLGPPTPSTLFGGALSLAIGRRIYEEDCAACHGKDGRTDAESAKFLRPPPRNLSDPFEMARVDDGRMYAAIKLGRPGTAMGGWGELLTPPDIIHLMRYVRTLQQPLPAGMTEAGLDVLVGDQIYHKYCVECHGERGDAQTPLGRGLSPRPRDFTDARQMARTSERQMAEVVMRGSPGTAMAPWGGILTPEDLRRVLLFIRKNFQRPP